MNIIEKLQHMQVELKAPKNLYNSFGKYKYRNAEGICEAVKPLLEKYHVALVISDKLLNMGERFYVEANVTLMDCESSEVVLAKALAREADEKKGMDESQITGTASSYARKYALNGLFLLDDTKDADTDEYHEAQKDVKEAYKPKTITPEQKVGLLKEMNRTGMDTEALLKWAKVKTIDDMTPEQYTKSMTQLKGFPSKEAK